MPTDQAEAIVLRTANVADQDKIAVFFCREKGLLRGVAKGARKFGNRFGSSLEPLSVVRVFYYEKERRDLVTVSGCDLIESFFEMQAEPDTAFLLTYFAELVEEFAPTRAQEDVLYRLLLSILRCLKGGGDREFAAAYFEAWFLQANGLLPDVSRCAKCRKPLERGWLGPRRDGAYCPDCAPLKKDELPAGIQDFLRWVRKNPPPGACAPPFPPDRIAAIRRTLQALIVYHMEREPKSLHVLKTK
jgi:DNA repair protein RecO (recombination protein O)